MSVGCSSLSQPTDQRWSRGHKARGQGQGHKKKSETKAKDSLSEDRHSRGQGQECSRPRPRTKDTSASAFQKKTSSQKFFGRSPKKRSSQKFFKRSPRKNVFQKFFQALHKTLTIQKIMLSSSPLQGRPRGLHLCYRHLRLPRANRSAAAPVITTVPLHTREQCQNASMAFGQVCSL